MIAVWLGCIGASADADADGFRVPKDCDDLDPQRFPGAPEACDGVDQDCDGTADEDFDVDGDGFVDAQAPACWFAGVAADCLDVDPLVHPGAAEACNHLDDDCNGVIDDPYDGDGDLSPDADDPACEGLLDLDCNDDDTAISPLVPEVCNGVDDNCNDRIDEVCGTTTTLEPNCTESWPFTVCLGPKEWHTATDELCPALGKTLASVLGAAEQEQIIQASALVAAEAVWIGLDDRDVEGVFAWASGTPVDFTAWAPGQPSAEEDRFDCVVSTADGWLDADCKAQVGYACR